VEESILFNTSQGADLLPLKETDNVHYEATSLEANSMLSKATLPHFFLFEVFLKWERFGGVSFTDRG
jgi:hypothetical protein